MFSVLDPDSWFCTGDVSRVAPTDIVIINVCTVQTAACGKDQT